MSPIKFFYQAGPFSFKGRNKLKAFLTRLFKAEGRQVQSLNFIFCTDRQLLEINRNFLKHDDYTDIITFDFAPGLPVEGEIYISVDRVKENAKSFGVPFPAELHRVIFHGALHLCGYGDKSVGEKKEMRAQEDKYLRKYFR